MIIVRGEILLEAPKEWKSEEASLFSCKQRQTLTWHYESMEVLRFELSARLQIVEAARQFHQSGVRFATFQKSECNPSFWVRTKEGGFRLKEGVLPSEGLGDIFSNGKKYSLECATAVVIILYKGMLESLGKETFNHLFGGLLLQSWNYDSDLILVQAKLSGEACPGDVQYVENPDVSPKTPHWQGENVVKLGEDEFFGHGIGIKSGQGIIDSLNKHRKPGAKESARMKEMAVFPDYPALYQKWNRLPSSRKRGRRS